MTIDTSHRSPSHSPRGAHRIGMVILHSTVGSYESSLAWLCNPTSRVSCHYLISRSGHIAQLVPDERAAWHAGNAIWGGKAAINELSIGIELANSTGIARLPRAPLPYPEWPLAQPYPDAQVDAAVALVTSLMARYGLTRDEVLRHADVAVPRGRKSDPLGFAWYTFLARLTPPPIVMPPPLYTEYSGLFLLRRYKVQLATWVRATPERTGARVRDALRGTELRGTPVKGGELSHPRLGVSDEWVRIADGYVWAKTVRELP